MARTGEIEPEAWMGYRVEERGKEEEGGGKKVRATSTPGQV